MNNKFIQDIANTVARIVVERLEQGSNLLFNNRIEWMNTAECAKYLRISENNLRVKVSRGEIQVHGRLGKCWRFRRDKLDELLNSPNQGLFND